MTYTEEIEAMTLAEGEQIEAIVVGDFGGRNWTEKLFIDENSEDSYRNAHIPFPIELKGKPIAWDEAKPYLNYKYDTGYGGADCHPFYVWTKTRILVCGVYDGSTWISAIPRNPIECVPDFIGGE